jgi:GNAT superfamily N-acetyltransferase
MTRADVDRALDWAAAAGWNPGIHDADCFYATDPHGFWIGELAGEPIACLSAVAYDERFGFLGLYIVKPDFRGHGFGLQLWNAGLAYLGPRTIGLDGVVTQQDKYRKSGFTRAYRTIRYEGRGSPFGNHHTVQ